MCACLLDEWDPVNQEDLESDRLTGLEDFGTLLRPLGLSEKKPVPDPIPFSEHDPLGALASGSVSADTHLLYKGNDTSCYPPQMPGAFVHLCFDCQIIKEVILFLFHWQLLVSIG